MVSNLCHLKRNDDNSSLLTRSDRSERLAWSSSSHKEEAAVDEELAKAALEARTQKDRSSKLT